MFDWLIKNPGQTLISGSVLSLITFLSNLVIYVSDGRIDSTELHALITSANGIQLVIVIIVILILKAKDKKNNDDNEEDH